MDDNYDYEEEPAETYIDPRDLDIITNNRTWRPTEAQIEAYANQLEFDLDNDPPEVLQIAEKYLTQPLPDNWARAFTKVDPQLLYIELDTNEIHLSTDLEEQAKKEYLELMEEYQAQLREEEEKAKKVTVVPRKKIAPLGAKQRQEDKIEKREKDFLKNIKQNQQNQFEDEETKELKAKMNKEKLREDKVKKEFFDFSKQRPYVQPQKPIQEEVINDNKRKQSSGIDYEYNEDHYGHENSSDDDTQVIHIEDHNPDVSQSERSNQNQNNANNMKKNHFHSQKEVFEDEKLINKKQKEKEIQEKNEKNQKRETMKGSSGTVLNLKEDSSSKDEEEDDDEEIERFKAKNINVDHFEKNQFSTPVGHQNKDSIESNDNIVIKVKSEEDNSFSEEKSKYLEKAQEALQKYKEKLKEKYNKDKDDTFKEMNEQYERQLNIEKRKIKDQRQKDNTKELRELQNQLQEDADRELEKYTKALKDQYEKMNSANSVDDYDNEISELELKKQKLLSSIKLQKLKNEHKKEEEENGLLQKKYLIDEKKKIQKETMNTKQQIKISSLEKEYEKNYQEQIKQIEKEKMNQSQSSIKAFNPEASIPYNEILKEYQKQLDETFEIKKKEIEKEMEIKMSSDLEAFKTSSLTESTDKVNLITSEISSLEKDYYNELGEIRRKGTEGNIKNTNQIKEKLNRLSSLFDKIKNDTSTVLSNQIKELTINIQHFVRTDTNDKDLTQLEEKVEEYICNILSEKTIVFRKMKSLYDLSEREFIEKELLIDYYIDILSFMNKNIIEKPLFENDNISSRTDEENNFISKLFQYGKDKQNEYRTKNRNLKGFKFFPFIDMELVKLNAFSNDSNINMSMMNYSYADNSMVNIQPSLHKPNQSYLFNHSSSTPNIRTSQQNSYIYHGKQNQQPVPLNNSITSIRLNPQMNEPNNKVSSRYTINSNNGNLNTYSQSTRSLNGYNNENINSRQDVIGDHYEENNNYNIVNNNTNEINSERALLLKLPNDIIATFSDSVFKLYSNIIDFVSDETICLNKEYAVISHQVQLSSKLTEINENGDLLQYSQAFNEEKLKSIRKEKIHMSKVDTFEMIKSHIDEVFSFIMENSTRKDIFTGKFEMILKHIEDYNQTFNSSTRRNLSVDNVANISIEYDKRRPNSSYDRNNLNNNINVENVNNSFTNFYQLYGPNRLNEKFNTNYSHEFFNYKKNNEYLNYKVMSNSNYNSNINPSRNFFFGKGYHTYY